MKKIIRNILIFLSYFLYDAVFIIIADSFGFDYFKLSNEKKILFSTITSFLFIIFLIFVYKDEIKKDINDFKENGKKYISKYFTYYVIGVILMGVTNLIIQSITKCKEWIVID